MLGRIVTTTLLAALVASPATAGDPVPGVDVLLEQIPGGQIYTAETDADGNIIFENLPPGDYRVFQNVERPTINVSGPAVFTPSAGDDIGTLTVTGRAPIMIDRIVARRLGAVQADRADAIPLAAESLNSSRSNTGGLAEPMDQRRLQNLRASGALQEVTATFEAEAAADARCASISESATCGEDRPASISESETATEGEDGPD